MAEKLSNDERLRGWIRVLEPGDILFHEGDAGSSIFVLVSGKVEILRHGSKVATVDVEEAVIGEIAVLTHQPRSATVRALTQCRLVAIESLEDLIRLDARWGIRIAKVLASRLRRIEGELDRLMRHATSSKDEESVVILTHIINGLASAIRPGPGEDDTTLPV